jgi:thiol-disulfide isomerase/thioredoxin
MAILVPRLQLRLFESFAVLGCAVACLSSLAGCERQTSPSTVSTSALQQTQSQTAEPPAKVSHAIELRILDDAGLERLIASHRGDVVVMDVWSTACPPCIHDFPRFVKLFEQYHAKGLASISLSLDYEGIGRPEDQAPRVLDFLRRQHATFDNVLASEDSDSMYKKLGIPSVPAVFVYDRTGKLLTRLQEAEDNPKEKPLYDRVEQLTGKLLSKR